MQAFVYASSASCEKNFVWNWPTVDKSCFSVLFGVFFWTNMISLASELLVRVLLALSVILIFGLKMHFETSVITAFG